MKRSSVYLLVLTIFASSIGCPSSSPHPGSQNSGTSAKDKPDRETISIEPGFYSAGPEYEQVAEILSNANARIGLDYYQGIEWYDRDTKSWVKVDKIEDLQPLLEAIGDKSLIVVSTGKAIWEQSDDHIESIASYAKLLGYRTTLVTVDHSSGTIISKVIHHLQ